MMLLITRFLKYIQWAPITFCIVVTSGAEYLNEMISSAWSRYVFDHFLLSVSALIADPKLHIFSWERQLITMFPGLRSPWIIFLEWRYANPSIIWNAKEWTVFAHNFFVDISFLRSAYIMVWAIKTSCNLEGIHKGYESNFHIMTKNHPKYTIDIAAKIYRDILCLKINDEINKICKVRVVQFFQQCNFSKSSFTWDMSSYRKFSYCHFLVVAGIYGTYNHSIIWTD